MIDISASPLLNWITTRSWYEYSGEFIALTLAILSILVKLNNKNKTKIWRNFLRSSALLIAFSTIAIPWMIKDIL